MAKISVIVPVYRVEAYLHRCVDSILGQTYEDFELVLVDDGSPDTCGMICDEYAQKDKRVHVIHQENGGLSAARNTGIDWFLAHSDSQWITFVDSDDWLHRSYLEVMLSAAEEFGVNQVMCEEVPVDRFVEDAPLPEDYKRVMDAEDAYIQYDGPSITACDKILHRSLLKDIRFPIGKLHEDAYVTHLWTFACEKIAICDVPLYYYYSNPDSITRVKWSESRLHEFEGHELRLAYLQEHGYERAYRKELEIYTHVMFAQLRDLTQLAKQEPAFRKHRQSLWKKNSQIFRLARSHGLYPYKEEYVWIYELAYPVKPFWILCNILKNIVK